MSIINQFITESQNRSQVKSENPNLRRFWASRARRRRYTVLFVALVAAGAVLFSLSSYISGTTVAVTVLVPAIIVVMAAVATLSVQLSLFARTGVGHQNLDERQRVEMDRATRIGHQGTTALLMGTFLLLALTTTFSPERVAFPDELLLPLVWIMALVHSCLPTCYLAWTQPDELLEEDEPATA